MSSWHGAMEILKFPSLLSARISNIPRIPFSDSPYIKQDKYMINAHMQENTKQYKCCRVWGSLKLLIAQVCVVKCNALVMCLCVHNAMN